MTVSARPLRPHAKPSMNSRVGFVELVLASRLRADVVGAEEVNFVYTHRASRSTIRPSVRVQAAADRPTETR